jgi:predicted nucleic acid-binding protein
VLLTAALERRYQTLASVPLLLQYEAVVTRSEHLAAAGISEADVQVLLAAFALVAIPIRISYLWRPTLTDPDDDLVLETAVNGNAEAVVTFNRRHFEPAAARFGIAILAPGKQFDGWRVAHEEKQFRVEASTGVDGRGSEGREGRRRGSEPIDQRGRC